LQVVSHRLARRRLVDVGVQQVVGDLEGAAQRAAIALQRPVERGANGAAHAGAPGDE
jgi:hypothetical protein